MAGFARKTEKDRAILFLALLYPKLNFFGYCTVFENKNALSKKAVRYNFGRLNKGNFVKGIITIISIVLALPLAL